MRNTWKVTFLPDGSRTLTATRVKKPRWKSTLIGPAHGRLFKARRQFCGRTLPSPWLTFAESDELWPRLDKGTFLAFARMMTQMSIELAQ